MRLISWNVNGIRSVEGKGFLDWFAAEKADVVCVQEIKARPDQLSGQVLNPSQYHAFWHPAEKPGYSGVAIFSKKDPLKVVHGLGTPAIDREGRVITAEFKDFVVVNSYFPNSQRDHARLGYKLEFCDAMFKFLEKYRSAGKHVVLCGDLNIAHKAIDLKNPKSNENNAGFLPEERAWLDEFTAKGWVDAFRKFEPGPDHYSWWSYMPGVRDRNIGWRLDYHFVNPEFVENLKGAKIHPHVRGSDHCPVVLELKG